MAEKQTPEEEALSKLFKDKIPMGEIPGDTKEDMMTRVLFKVNIMNELRAELGREPTSAEIAQRIKERNTGQIY